MKHLRLIFYIINFALGISVILTPIQVKAQTTHNIDIIWQKQGPDTIEIRAWGYALGGGDVNGDGKSDVLISSEANYNAGGFTGRIYIFTNLLDTAPEITLVGDTITSAYGHSICTGDFNHDGYADVVVGAPSYGATALTGKTYVYYGGNPMDSLPDWVVTNQSNTGESFGQAVAAGDVSGDGIDDLIVGAFYYGDMNARGRVYVYYGDSLGLHTWPDIVMNGRPEAGYWENLGNAVAAADLNCDGYADIIVGAYNNCGGGYAAGKVYYYLSNNAPIDTIPDGWVYGEAAQQWLGAFNVSAIPIDTVGFKPVGWFGTPFWPTTTGDYGVGKCYMVPGDTTGVLMPDWAITGEDTALGYWLSSAGYADNDKLGDFLAGASPAFEQRGRAYLWLRRPIMKVQYDAYIQGRYPGPFGGGPGSVLGAKVALAGDVDGDGKDEFLVSNYYADSSHMVWLCKYTGPDGVTGEPEFKIQNSKFKLFQSSPNPFSHTTNIKYQISKSGMVSLKVYNIQGQLIKTLVGGEKPPGLYSVSWDGSDQNNENVSQGVYFYKIVVDSFNKTGKMIYEK